MSPLVFLVNICDILFDTDFDADLEACLVGGVP